MLLSGPCVRRMIGLVSGYCEVTGRQLQFYVQSDSERPLFSFSPLSVVPQVNNWWYFVLNYHFGCISSSTEKLVVLFKH